jgi:hypothetical protein
LHESENVDEESDGVSGSTIVQPSEMAGGVNSKLNLVLEQIGLLAQSHRSLTQNVNKLINPNGDHAYSTKNDLIASTQSPTLRKDTIPAGLTLSPPSPRTSVDHRPQVLLPLPSPYETLRAMKNVGPGLTPKKEMITWETTRPRIAVDCLGGGNMVNRKNNMVNIYKVSCLEHSLKDNHASLQRTDEATSI